MSNIIQIRRTFTRVGRSVEECEFSVPRCRKFSVLARRARRGAGSFLAGQINFGQFHSARCSPRWDIHAHD